MEYLIDFVVTWVDSDDPQWKADYAKYKNIKVTEDKARFRNWDLFKYWFRSIEKNAPWVNKVYLVTNGKNPDWINPNHPKLVLVKHSDYIPEEYLPTFNSHTIELFMHKIPGLSEHFVYFNDDCYLNAPVTPEYFFKEGLPCDNNEELLSNKPFYNPLNPFNVRIIEYCNVALINYHFKRKEVVKASPKRWYGTHLGIKGIIKSLFLSKQNNFECFVRRHNEQPFLKSTFEEAWEKEEKMLKQSCTRFRQDVSLSPYFMRYWQFATNKFYPIKYNTGRFFVIIGYAKDSIQKAFHNNNIKSLCLNDSPVMPEEEYQEMFKFVDKLFLEKFPEKSSFEI